jgi:hypothetical protein
MIASMIGLIVSELLPIIRRVLGTVFHESSNVGSIVEETCSRSRR